MPSFGDFETYGEALAITEERGHVSTVWQARKAGGDNRLYVIKCYAPRALDHPAVQREGALERDRALEFLDGVKQLKKAQTEGGRNLAPIHDLGKNDGEAWYATDHYPRNNLKAWIARRGGVDSAALRHVLQSVVAGCLALKRARGFSHGNLKPSNVFLVGQPRPLKKTPLVLTDAYPAAPLQLAGLESADRSQVGDLLAQAVEVEDLRKIGELILQLVEGRLFSRSDDYNYPVPRSPIWDILGKDAEFWLNKCNELVNPQLSPESINFEKLANEFGSPTGGLPSLTKGLGEKARKVAPILGIVVGVTILGVGAYFVIPPLIKSIKERSAQKQAGRLQALEGWTNNMLAAEEALNSTNFTVAVGQFAAAKASAGQIRESDKETAAEHGRAWAELLAGAQEAFDKGDAEAAAEQVRKAAAAAMNYTHERSQQWLYRATLGQAWKSFTVTNLSEARNWQNLATKLGPADLDLDRQMALVARQQAEKPWATFTNQANYQSALTAWQQQGVAAELEKVVRRDFDQGLPSNKRPDLATYLLPGCWANVSSQDRETEVASLRQIAEGSDRRDFGAWKAEVENNFGPLVGNQLAPAWEETRTAVTNKIGQVESVLSQAEGGQANRGRLQDDVAKLKKYRDLLTEISSSATKGGQPRQSLTNRALLALAEWTSVRSNVDVHITAIAGDQTWASLKKNYPWFTADLAGGLAGVPELNADPSQPFPKLPAYPQTGQVVPDNVPGELDSFKSGARAWWKATSGADPSGLPLANSLVPLIGNSNQGGPGDALDFSDETKLLNAIKGRALGRASAAKAVGALRTAWSSVTNSPKLLESVVAWQKLAPGQPSIVQQLVRSDFEAQSGSIANLQSVPGAVSAAASTVEARLNTNYYAPPAVLGTIDATNRQTELSALNDVVQGRKPYLAWVNGLNASYGPVSSLSDVVPEWKDPRSDNLAVRIAGTKTSLAALTPPYKPRSSPDDLAKILEQLTSSTASLERLSRTGGARHRDLQDSGRTILRKASDLKTQVAELEQQVTQYQNAQTALRECHYDLAVSICQTNEGFDGLLGVANQGKRQFDILSTALANCDCGFLATLTPEAKTNTCFQPLIAQAVQLQEFQRLIASPTNWAKVNDQFSHLDATQRNQACFQKIASWIAQNNPKLQYEAALRARLNVFKVWFLGMKNDGTITDFVTKRPAAEQPRGIDVGYYLARLAELRKDFENAGLNDAASEFKDLEKKINNW